jgi:hypothetical protein
VLIGDHAPLRLGDVNRATFAAVVPIELPESEDDDDNDGSDAGNNKEPPDSSAMLFKIAMVTVSLGVLIERGIGLAAVRGTGRV